MNSFYDDEEQNDKTLPKWKLPSHTLRGYTGDLRNQSTQDHILESAHRRRVIRGYSGFIPDGKSITGRPIIPSDEQQRINNEMSMGTYSMPDTSRFDSYESEETQYTSFKRMDLLERYADATKQLLAREQSPEMLIKLVQAKISERVQSYAQQLIAVKLEFQQYHVNPAEGFNEGALREVLERMNIQLDDVQSLALFAFFDVEGVGRIDWEDFADYAMVSNPRSGTAVRPKQIISTLGSGNWDN